MVSNCGSSTALWNNDRKFNIFKGKEEEEEEVDLFGSDDEEDEEKERIT